MQRGASYLTHSRCATTLRRGRPASLYGANVRRWWQRLMPTSGHDAWRGCTPVRAGQSRFLAPSALRPALWFATKTGSTLAYTFVDGRWIVRMPLQRHPSAAALVFPLLAYAATRIQKLWAGVLRGLGGVCRLKVRFKGKSFKWHRRRGALMLRFGHAHLVAVTPLPGVRWRRLGRMKIVLFGADWWSLLEYAQAVCWWRPVNVYHGRGIRLRRQLVLRKAGKVSAYR